ncbi:MAG: hypothetical protein EXR64_00125 [Dehalococcoidia bacterium]|nr:hypothetical protein [Dehalococcoidia bacterium]
MGRRQPLRQTFFFSLVATAISSAVLAWTDGGGWADAASIAPLFFAMIFFTMLATNRLSSSLADRVAARQAAKAPPRGPAAVAPTGERPDHNQRRRQRADRARERRRR